MNYEVIDLPTQPLENCAELPTVTSLQAQSDGTLLCSLLFARPSLLRVQVSADGAKVERFVDLKVEETAGDLLLGVTGGLRPTTSGDTVFALLHKGFLPAFLRRSFGGAVEKLSGAALLAFLAANDGGMGALVRHSVVQIMDDKFSVRRYKDPGVLIDTAHIGDFIFGLSPSAIWREPYLNSEKRETLRGDLAGNGGLHRDDDGTFWLANRAGRLLRLNQTEIKAKPTPLKLSEAALSLSAPSSTDGWLYASTGHGQDLVRVRRNPISFEEELQKIATFEQKITGLASIDEGEEGKVVVALEGPQGALLKSLPTFKAEDAELVPAVPTIRDEGSIREFKSVSSLTRLPGRREIWGGEAHSKKPRIVKISGL